MQMVNKAGGRGVGMMEACASSEATAGAGVGLKSISVKPEKLQAADTTKSTTPAQNRLAILLIIIAGLCCDA